MSGEFKHVAKTASLSSSAYSSTTEHIADGQTLGDVLWFNGTTWVRLPAGIPLGATNFPTGRIATYFIAASNASAQSKAQADYICAGADDEDTIQTVVDLLVTLGGGRIILSEGTFKMKADQGSQLIVMSNITLEGQGASTILEGISGGNCIINIGYDGVTASSDADFENIVVRNFRFDSSGAATCNGVGMGLSTINHKLRNILIENLSSMPSFPKDIVGMEISANTDVLENITVKDIIYEGGDANPGIAFNISEGVTFNRIGGFLIDKPCILNPFNDGISVIGAFSDFIINKPTVINPGRYGITYQDNGASIISHTRIIDPYITGITGTDDAGIYGIGGNDIHIIRPIINSQYYCIRFGASIGTADLIFVSGGYLKTTGANLGAILSDKDITNLEIDNNYLECVNYYPIRLQGTVGSVYIHDNRGVETVKDGAVFARADNGIVGKVCNNIYNQSLFTEGTGLQSVNNSIIDGTTYGKTSNSGTSPLGNGTQQTLAHGLGFTPTVQQIALISRSATASPYHSASPDATNIYVTAGSAQPWAWATVG